MSDETQTKLSFQDQEVIDLLEEAKRLYERYCSINDFPVLASESDEPSTPMPTWDLPLTLVVKAPK